MEEEVSLRPFILIFSNCKPDSSTGSGAVVMRFLKFVENEEFKLFTPENSSIFQFLHPKLISIRLSLGWLFHFLENRKTLENGGKIIFFGGEFWLILLLYRKWLVKRGIEIIHFTNGPETRYRNHFNSSAGILTNLLTKCMSLAFSRVDFIYTVSESDKDWLELNYDFVKIKCLPPPINEVFESERALSTRMENTFVYCGRWTLEKGKDITIEFIHYLDAREKFFVFNLVGVEDERTVLSEIGEVQFGKILVYPFIRDKEKLRDIYDRSKYLFFPSRGESFGLVIAEAMARNCIALVTKVGFVQNTNYPFVEMDKYSFIKMYENVLQNEELQNEMIFKAKSIIFGFSVNAWREEITRKLKIT